MTLATITDVCDDYSLKLLIDNMMSVASGTSLLAIVRECFNQFGERYFGMKQKDWFHIVNKYVSNTTKRYDIMPEETFYWKAAESSINDTE